MSSNNDWGFGGESSSRKKKPPKSALMNFGITIFGVVLFAVYGIWKINNTQVGIGDSTESIIMNVILLFSVITIVTAIVRISRARRRNNQGY